MTVVITYSVTDKVVGNRCSQLSESREIAQLATTGGAALTFRHVGDKVETTAITSVLTIAIKPVDPSSRTTGRSRVV